MALNRDVDQRFDFPQISLEGKRVWIVGMAPLGMRRVLLTKFLFSTAVSMMVTMILVGTSCAMLSVSIDRIIYFTVTVGVMSFTLNALAVGLGAVYPNFREENPSKIVSGFGGTLCLVLSFLYIVGMVTLMAMTSRWAFGSSTMAFCADGCCSRGVVPAWLAAVAGRNS